MQRNGPAGRAATQSVLMLPAMKPENRFDAPRDKISAGRYPTKTEGMKPVTETRAQSHREGKE